MCSDGKRFDESGSMIVTRASVEENAAEEKPAVTPTDIPFVPDDEEGMFFET